MPILKPVTMADDKLEEEYLSVEYLLKLYKRLGLKENITTSECLNKGDVTRANITTPVWKFIEALIVVWKALYPSEYEIWMRDFKNDLEIERPIKAHIKAGGYQPVAYPLRFVEMMRLFLPNIKLQNKEFIKKFVSLFPEFKKTKYRI